MLVASKFDLPGIFSENKASTMEICTHFFTRPYTTGPPLLINLLEVKLMFALEQTLELTIPMSKNTAPATIPKLSENNTLLILIANASVLSVLIKIPPIPLILWEVKLLLSISKLALLTEPFAMLTYNPPPH